MTSNGQYPRRLRAVERDLLWSVLPPDRAGYRAYRERIDAMVVIGEGRRGRGDLVLGLAGDAPDVSGPLPQVIASGGVETSEGVVSVTVRELFAGQIDIEIVSDRGEPVPDTIDERRRWSYSDWLPGRPSPSSGTPVREVMIGPGVTLGISVGERRLWVYEAVTGLVLLLPVTGFYNELMLYRGVRDPKTALVPGRLFDELGLYADEDLREAFLAANRIRHRVEVSGVDSPPPGKPRPSFLRRFFTGLH